jgi:hypothetical protein
LIRATVPYNRASAGPAADAEREGPTILKERLARAVRPARTVFRKEIGAAVNDAVGPRQAHLEAELRDLRRVLQDDMDAANEATAVFGRLLSQLGDRLEEIESRLEALSGRLDEVAGATRPRRAAAKPRAARRPANPAEGSAPASE